MTDDTEAEIAETALFELLLHLSQQRDVLLHTEGSTKAEYKVGVRRRAIASARAKQLSIDTALHQVAGTASSLFKKPAKVEVRRKQHASQPVKPGKAGERHLFNAMRGAGSAASGQRVKEPVSAGRGIFMHVGVPRSRQ